MHNTHISQIPNTFQGTATYTNELYYYSVPAQFTHDDCTKYAAGMVKHLADKVDNKPKSSHAKKWTKQKELYQAILKYLTLHKQ